MFFGSCSKHKWESVCKAVHTSLALLVTRLLCGANVEGPVDTNEECGLQVHFALHVKHDTIRSSGIICAKESNLCLCLALE